MATGRRNPPVLMTCRLDGPTPEIAKRLVDDAVAVEAKGLAGNVVIDARGIPLRSQGRRDGGYGYGGYDESFREAAKLLEKAGMNVTLDEKNDGAPGRQREGCGPLLRVVLARQVRGLLRVRARRGRLAPGQFRGDDAAQRGYARCGARTCSRRAWRRRSGRSRSRTRRLPEAGRVLRLPRDRRVHAGRVLRPHDA